MAVRRDGPDLTDHTDLTDRPKKSAPGYPKLYQTSLSAATGEVLTRFARRHPSDLGQAELNARAEPGQQRSQSTVNGQRDQPGDGV